MRSAYDVAVIGSGPNGLAAGIVAAQHGLRTVIHESNATIGGGLRTSELTQPGFAHDLCSSVHPMAVASPFLRSLPLAAHGLQWITPTAAAAHPLDGGDAVMLWNDVERTADALGADRARYHRTIGALARAWDDIATDLLSPIGLPAHPLSYARFAVQALLPAQHYADLAFNTAHARALFAGIAAHAIVPLTYAGSAAIGLVLSAVAHVHGWPVAARGSQSIADALAAHFRSLGGTLVTGSTIDTTNSLPACHGCCSTHRRRRWHGSWATGSLPRIHSGCDVTRTALAYSKSTGRSTHRFHGQRTNAVKQARYMSEAGSTKSPRRKPQHGVVNMWSAHL